MARPLEDEPGIDDPVPGGDGGGGGGTGGGGSPAPAAIGTTIRDVTFVKQETSSVLRILAYANVASNDDFQLIGYLIVDGMVVQTCPINLIMAKRNARTVLTFFVYRAGLPAGPRRIVFSVLNKEPDSPLTVKAGASIEITELKQAAL